MPPELEEVVVDPDALPRENLGPDAGDALSAGSGNAGRSTLP